jgi:hypothetical protein
LGIGGSGCQGTVGEQRLPGTAAQIRQVVDLPGKGVCGQLRHVERMREHHGLALAVEAEHGLTVQGLLQIAFEEAGQQREPAVGARLADGVK